MAPSSSPTASLAIARTAPISASTRRHAHLNMPASLMWARGFETRPVRVRFEQPPGRKWRVASQLYPTDDPLTFTAPNFHYLMDSPTEFSAYTLRTFTVPNTSGRGAHIPDCAAPRRHRRRGRRPRQGRRAHRPRGDGGLRRVPAIREQHLHVSRRLPAVGERRRHGTSQQHRAVEQRRAPQSRSAKQPSRHGGARVLPLVEHGAHSLERPRAVQLRRGRRLRRAVAGRGLHQLLRRADHAARRADAARGDAGELGRRHQHRDAQPRPRPQIGRGHEPPRAVRRCRRLHRSHELGQHVHLLLHVRRSHRPRPRPLAARAIERPGDARHLHAGPLGEARPARPEGARAWSPRRTRWTI